MSTKDFTANVISATKVVPDGNFKDSKASGIWDINEALDLIKGGNWPNVANINPAAFVDGLFSVHLNNDGSSNQVITNGIDLTKGGLVWGKSRNLSEHSFLVDSARGKGSNNNFKVLRSGSTAIEQDLSNRSLSSFNSNGFTFQGADDQFNSSGNEYVYWTFRKQPKFFDVVTYSGNGTAGRTVAHNLGSVPGMMIVKETNGTRNWIVYHRSLGNTKYLYLNATDAEAAHVTAWNDTSPTSSVFSVGTANNVNRDGGTYVAYLFAHNNDDGGFGEPGDQDIIKCGTYTGNGSTTGTVVNLGFEPQFIMLKRTDDTQNAHWYVFDSMRGMVTGGADPYLYWNNTNAEVAGNALEVTPTGFQLKATGTGFNGSNATYVYMAIRRGGMQTPTAASSVFKVDQGHGSNVPNFESGFPVDFALLRQTSGDSFKASARLTSGQYLETSSTAAESSNSNYSFDFQDGWVGSAFGTSYYSWMWKRARGFCDVVAYTGDGQAGRTVSHNLGVAPEMMWVKRRDSSTNGSWWVYHAGAQDSPTYVDVLALNSDGAVTDSSGYFAGNPTASNFSVNQYNTTNGSGNTYIAYLFATLSGVSKLGSYTGNAGASTINVDCGFTGDTPSFILIKESSGTGNWWVFDSARGIVTGTEKALYLNTTDAETSAYDYIDPYSGGFSLSINSGINTDGATFIFYAIAATS